MLRAVVVALMVAGCGTPPQTAPIVPRPARLPGPPAIDPATTGAEYLVHLAVQLQPNWSGFLEDCRLRLPIDHALNDSRLVATLTLAIDRRGALSLAAIAGSGNGDFDRAATGVVRDASKVDPPPVALLSDDDRTYVEWIFARDVRQAGPATAHVIMRRLPIGDVAKRLIRQGELARAARRIADEPAGPARIEATQLAMTEALREALGGVGGSRELAIEAIGRAHVTALAPQLRELISVTTDTELRLAATTALAQLGDKQAVDKIAALLANDLRYYPKIALAETAALVDLGAADRAQKIIGDALATSPLPTALQAHGIAFAGTASPVDAKLGAWFSKGDGRTRAAVCAAQPIGASAKGRAVIARGLRDPDATVRATCADAASQQFGARSSEAPTRGDARVRGASDDPARARDLATFDKRLRDLSRDRDRHVRSRAIAALAAHGIAMPDAADDTAPEVRIAAAPALPEAALLALFSDGDPDVRAAAVTLLRDTQPSVVAKAATDPAAQVRLAAIPALTDDALLDKLSVDTAPDVATAAFVQLVARRGRERTTTDLLGKLSTAPAGGAERVRIALAWLLGT
ncbi:MAG: HEAT repeat domain-containing protein [Kofleriaceae bacterium]